MWVGEGESYLGIPGGRLGCNRVQEAAAGGYVDGSSDVGSGVEATVGGQQQAAVTSGKHRPATTEAREGSWPSPESQEGKMS